jgi:predicted ATP-dependent Lon-type protease
LKKIKDEAKRAKVESIATTIPELNVTLTTRASERVTQIETVLVAIESRADKAAATGIDVAGVRTLISSAETAIASARAAIVVQLGKTYTVTIASDTSAKGTLETTRNTFRADIKVMNTAVKAAHDATRKAAEALKAIPKIDDVVVPTPVVPTTSSETPSTNQ